jgi:hypothetical protein
VGPTFFVTADRCSLLYNPLKAMDFKTVISRFVYRIEPKPGGGFIATCKDPSAPAIEGATREEVQKKIQETISASLGTEFPALKSALATNDLKLHYHVEAKPGGGFMIHHGDTQSASSTHEPIEGSTREHLENLIESKLLSTLMDRLPPELHQQITDKLNSGGLDIEVNRTISVSTKRGDVVNPLLDIDPDKHSGSTSGSTDPVPLGNSGADAHQNAILSASSDDIQLAATSNASESSQSPVIRYEKASGGKFFPTLLALAILGLLVYLYLHRQ